MRNVRAVGSLPLAALIAAISAWPTTATAQFTKPPAPAAYALQDVTVVAPDGSKTEHVTIVVRGGLIEGMGLDVVIPPDAELLEGDSLMVYPGIIDAQGEVDFEFPEDEIDRDELEFWAPPRVAQGFTPHRRVTDYLTATGTDLKSERTKGVVAAAVHPNGPVMPGRGTMVLFRTDAETPSALVLQPALGPAMSFRGARGMYPSTLFGMMAFIRQAFEDARHDGLVRTAHSRDPRGVEIPEWDPDYEVLRAAMEGRAPVFFGVDRADDIRRVLTLSGEYGFKPVIVGGDEAWKLASFLREQQVPVLVSLDFPKPKRWKPKKDDEEGEEEQDTTAVQEEMQQEEVLDPAEEREKQRIENIYSNAGRLAQAGVSFALTSGGGKADIREGARKAIEYGLTETQALAAVSSSPAALLGVPYLASVAVGMPATFVVTDGALFDEDAEIRYTFVAGGLERGKEKKTTTAGDEAPTIDVTGTWEIELTGEGQTTIAKMTVTQEGAAFGGTGEMEFGAFKIEEGSVSGNNITFNIVMEFGGETLRSEATGTIEGDEGSGSGTGPFGPFEWRATRTGGPGEGALR